MNDIARANARQATAGMAWPDFLLPLLGVIRNPPGPQDFKIRCAAMAHALPEVTDDMRTVTAQRDLMRSCEFWPTPKEVLAVFADALRHKREMAALRLPKPEAEPERGPRTLAEIEAVRTKAAEARQALTGGEAMVREAVRPRYLTPQQLLAAHEQLAAQGNQASALRAEALRKQLGIAA